MKRKLLAIVMILAVLAMLFAGCSLFTVDEYRDYHQVVATVRYKDMSKDVLKGELLLYYTQYGASYIYYGWTEDETLSYLCETLSRQNLLLLHAKEYLARQADPDITDAEIAAMSAEEFLTVDERRYCIEQTNASFEESFRTLITDLEDEQAANEGTSDDTTGDDTTSSDEEELEARPSRPEEEDSSEYEDQGMTDESQLPEGFMDYIQDRIDAEEDEQARKNMNTALSQLRDNIESSFRDYSYYLNSQYETRILEKYREALGGELPEITDEEFQSRYQRMVNVNIGSYVDEEAYASALKSSSSDILFHKTKGYSQVRSILLGFSDDQKSALDTIEALVGSNEEALAAYRAVLALGTDIAGDMPSEFASLADLGIKVNVSDPDYDADTDELSAAYTDKGVDYKVVLYAMANDIAAKADKAVAAAQASGITDATQLQLVRQYATDEAITDWIYLVNDDDGMFDSDSYVLSPDGSASSYVEEYTVLGRALTETGINSTAIVPTAAFESKAALEYTPAEGQEPTEILAQADGKTYEISYETVTSEDENGEELSTTVYTLRTEEGNDISFIVNDYGIHVIYVKDIFVDESKGSVTEYTVDGETAGYILGSDYRHSYEVTIRYVKDEDGNDTDEIESVSVTVTTVEQYIKDLIEEERTSAKYSDVQYEIFADTSQSIVLQSGVYDGLLSEITG